MEWELRGDLPIYSQLVDQLAIAIISGEFAPGERLPSVRELAVQAGVNPNTMQRALSELERNDMVYTQRTSGRFVTEDTLIIARAKRRLAHDSTEAFLKAMHRLGYRREDVVSLLQEMKED